VSLSRLDDDGPLLRTKTSEGDDDNDDLDDFVRLNNVQKARTQTQLV
jgi:hypothetical protein